MTPAISLALPVRPTLAYARGADNTIRLRPGPDRSGRWLRNATAGLCVLAAAAATVSFTAQYRMAESARHLPAIAALEAAIPDAAAVVFACLGIALALHGRRARSVPERRTSSKPTPTALASCAQQIGVSGRGPRNFILDFGLDRARLWWRADPDRPPRGLSVSRSRRLVSP